MGGWCSRWKEKGAWRARCRQRVTASGSSVPHDPISSSARSAARYRRWHTPRSVHAPVAVLSSNPSLFRRLPCSFPYRPRSSRPSRSSQMPGPRGEEDGSSRLEEGSERGNCLRSGLTRARNLGGAAGNARNVEQAWWDYGHGYGRALRSWEFSR